MEWGPARAPRARCTPFTRSCKVAGSPCNRHACGRPRHRCHRAAAAHARDWPPGVKILHLVALALFVVLLRAAYDRRLRLAQEGIVLEDFEWDELSRIRNFSFLLGYLIELCLVYFAYYPILISLGFFGCIPFLGRTKEIQKQAREREAMDWVPKDHVQNGESA